MKTHVSLLLSFNIYDYYSYQYFIFSQDFPGAHSFLVLLPQVNNSKHSFLQTKYFLIFASNALFFFLKSKNKLFLGSLSGERLSQVAGRGSMTWPLQRVLGMVECRAMPPYPLNSSGVQGMGRHFPTAGTNMGSPREDLRCGTSASCSMHGPGSVHKPRDSHRGLSPTWCSSG